MLNCQHNMHARECNCTTVAANFALGGRSPRKRWVAQAVAPLQQSDCSPCTHLLLAVIITGGQLSVLLVIGPIIIMQEASHCCQADQGVVSCRRGTCCCSSSSAQGTSCSAHICLAQLPCCKASLNLLGLEVVQSNNSSNLRQGNNVAYSCTSCLYHSIPHSWLYIPVQQLAVWLAGVHTACRSLA